MTTENFYKAFLSPTRIDFKDGFMQTLPPTIDAQGRISYHAEFTQSLTALTPEQQRTAKSIVDDLLAKIESDVLAQVKA